MQQRAVSKFLLLTSAPLPSPPAATSCHAAFVVIAGGLRNFMVILILVVILAVLVFLVIYT